MLQVRGVIALQVRGVIVLQVRGVIVLQATEMLQESYSRPPRTLGINYIFKLILSKAFTSRIKCLI